MDKFKTSIKAKEEAWGEYLSQFPRFCQAEEFTQVPKVYLALILGFIVFLLLFLNASGQLISSFIGWAYPVHATLEAIESPTVEKRRQWFTYWVILSLLQSIEYFEDTILYWIPFYYLFKTIFTLYLMAPSVTGATTLYMLLFQYSIHSRSNPMSKAKQVVKRARSTLKKNT